VLEVVQHWLVGINDSLEFLAQSMVKMEAGLGLLLGVGFSMSASHFFSLLANRLKPIQIAVHLAVDAFGLGLAFLLGIFCDSLILAMIESVPLDPVTFANQMTVALWPGLFYVLVGAPYISDLIAVTIFAWIHLNCLLLLRAVYAVPLAKGLVVTSPGFVLALIVIALLFAQRWRSSYAELVREVPSRQ